MKSRYKLRQLFRRIKSLAAGPYVIKQDRIVPAWCEEVCPNPIFVLGPKRSGTSLVRRILNSHSSIACPPETHVLAHFAAMAVDERTPEGLRAFGVGKEEYLREVRNWASIYHEGFRRSQNKKRWADKTPRYVEYSKDLETLFGSETLYILVFRHPVSIAQSLAYRRLIPGVGVRD